eukprot:11191086-Lingulodinium_polyedra.AAC.1
MGKATGWMASTLACRAWARGRRAAGAATRTGAGKGLQGLKNRFATPGPTVTCGRQRVPVGLMEQ